MGVQPRTRHELREQERRATAVRRIGVVAAMLVVGAAVYFGMALSGNGSPPASRPNVGPVTNAAPSTTQGLAEAMNSTFTGTPPPDPSTATEPARTPTPKLGSIPPKLAVAVRSCQAQWRLQSVAFADAARSLEQWRRHVEIMNDLQAGRISLATAKAQWPYTTYKAGPIETAFRSADAALAASPDTCAVDESATGRTADSIRRCDASMRKVGNVLFKARVAITPWEQHLKDQTHFAMGMMTPAAAEAAWRVTWKKGQETLPPYEAAAAEARGATCPLGG